MDEIAKRFSSLTPEQLALLELRLKKQGLRSPLEQPVEVAQLPVVESEAELDWKSRPVEKNLSFSLYFFSDDGSKDSPDKYCLVLERAKFADQNDFSDVWTPERHFQDFGCHY